MSNRNPDRDRPPGSAGSPERPGSADLDADEMTPEEMQRLEAETDVLLDLVGLVERHYPDSPAFEDPRFLAWLAREHDDDPELLTDSQIRALAHRIMVDVGAEKFGVRRAARMPAPRSIAPAAASIAVESLSAERAVAVLDLSVAAGAGRALWDAECEAYVPLPPEMPAGRYLALRVNGESMEPLLHSGDVVLVRLGPEVAEESIVVAHRPDDGYVVKRVGRVMRRAVELCSLNPAFPPVTTPLRTNTVLGTVVLCWCDHGPAT